MCWPWTTSQQEIQSFPPKAHKPWNKACLGRLCGTVLNILAEKWFLTIMAFLIGTMGSINTKLSVLHGLTCFNPSQSPGDVENISSIQRSCLSRKAEAVCLECELSKRRRYTFCGWKSPHWGYLKARVSMSSAHKRLSLCVQKWIAPKSLRLRPL